MIPSINNVLTADIEVKSENTKSYKMNIIPKRVIGTVDGIEAVRQAIYKVLNTERFGYIIYSWNYGIELVDLYGKDDAYVIPELERRIKDALSTDDRIIGCDDFEFAISDKHTIAVTFTAKTIYGDLSIEKEVNY